MENIYYTPFKKPWTGLHVLSVMIFLLTGIYVTLRVDLDPTQPNIIDQVIKEFTLTNWMPLEFSHDGNSASKYFCFFIGEIFVYYIITNLCLGLSVMGVERCTTDVMSLECIYLDIGFSFFGISKTFRYLQAIFIIFRLYKSMVTATLISFWALIISLFIYNVFCRSRWETRGSKEEVNVESEIDLIIGNIFPQEAESMAFLTYITLCSVGYGHVPNVLNFLLYIGSLNYFIGNERLMVILIGLLSVNIPLILLAIINSRPLSNFSKREWNFTVKKEDIVKHQRKRIDWYYITDHPAIRKLKK